MSTYVPTTFGELKVGDKFHHSNTSSIVWEKIYPYTAKMVSDPGTTYEYNTDYIVYLKKG